MHGRGVRRAAMMLPMLLASAAAFGWSGGVHIAICEIAWQRLDPPAETLVRRIRAEGEAPQRTFAASCAWPDTARHEDHKSTYAYHFVNVPKGATTVKRARDCAAHDCVIDAIERYLAYVKVEADHERLRKRRAWSLAFLGHFVGDVHQPLHAAYGEDLGGNFIDVSWPGGRDNLHGYWDGEIAADAGWEGMDGGLRLARSSAPRIAAATDQGDALAWARESFRLARRVAYDVPADGRLDARYRARARDVAHRRIVAAGVRLARLLNAIARGPP